MRHRKSGYKLGRNASHRTSLYRNLAMALIRSERIITTVQKARAVRPFIERLITLARKGQLHHRRLAVSRLGPTADAEVKPGEGEDADHRTIVQKLFDELGPRFKDRAGGYTRIIKRHQRRLGDAGETAYLELLKQGETRSRAKASSAPRVDDQPKAPQVATEEQQPAAEQHAAEQPAPEQASQQPTEEKKNEGDAPKA